MLKRFCLLLCTVLCFLPMIPLCLPQIAHAKTVTWVRITDSDVGLYANCDSSKIIFNLQKSYYLQVLGEENGMYLVSVMQNEEQFPQIVGYVWKSEVDECYETPILPYYPTVRLTVNTNSAQIKLSPTPSAETVITVTNTQKVSFYGEVTYYGETWYYVYFCGVFGYVNAQNVTKPVIQLHPTPLAQEVVAPPSEQGPPQPVDEPTEQPPQSSVSEIFLIIFVVLLAGGISLALFLPGNVKKREVFDGDV